jgi:hypothetical protein
MDSKDIITSKAYLCKECAVSEGFNGAKEKKYSSNSGCCDLCEEWGKETAWFDNKDRNLDKLEDEEVKILVGQDWMKAEKRAEIREEKTQETPLVTIRKNRVNGELYWVAEKGGDIVALICKVEDTKVVIEV